MINSFDIETLEHDKKLVPYCIASIIEKEEKVFFGTNCVEEFLDYLEELAVNKKEKKKKKIYIFSHNLTFDASILIQYTKKNNFKFNGLFFKGNIYFFEIKFFKASVVFKCSYRFFPTKIEKAHSLLGTDKKLEFDHSKINLENFIEQKEKIMIYCMNDAKLVIQIIEKYDKIISKFIPNWFDIAHSLPGISLKIFENKFNKFKIEIQSNIEDDFLFRSAYFGGRCEVFGNPKKGEKIYHFDFTGMYAQIMLQDFNYGEYKIINKPNNIKANGFHFIEGFSDTDIPVLPHHSNKNNKLLFSNGYIKGLYWWEEILLFIKMGGIVLDVKFSIEFKKEGKIFKDFVEEFSRMRNMGKAENSICKLIVNSVYGRLGMGEMRSETKLLNKEEHKIFCKKNEKKIIKENWINDLVFVEYEKEKKSENLNSSVLIAAQITAKARIKLYNGFESIIKNNGRILYCDTDSIFSAFRKNMDNQKLDEIFFDIKKKETKIKKAVFALPKAYSLILENKEEITKIKGFNNINIPFSDFKKMFESNNKKKILIKTLEKSNFIITPKNVEKVIYLGEYDKRVFSENFTNTKALNVGIDQEYYREKQILKLKNDEEFKKISEKLKTKEEFKKEITIKEKKIDKIWDVQAENWENGIKLSLVNTEENLYKNTLLIEFLIKNNFFNKEFTICKKSTILKNLIEKRTLFLELIFIGDINKL